MRVLLATAVLIGGALFVSAPRGANVSAQGQSMSVQAGITTGERIRLRFEPAANSYDCTVIEVRGDFVGCQRSPGTALGGPDRWYNLKLVAIVERPLQQ